MVRNNKLLETLFSCAKQKGFCKGCIYGDGEDKQCVYALMNDILFFFKNPVPSDTATIIPLEELEEILSDRKEHLAFSEFINSIHVAQPSIRTISMKGNFINLYDNETNTLESFNKSDYYSTFRIWSTKPTDSLRNKTPWENSIDSPADNSPINKSKTANILDFISKMTN